MPRATYRLCRNCGQMHDITTWPEDHRDPEPARSDFPSPGFIRDEMEPVQSMATGKLHTSKSGIRAEYRRLGMVEIGNDPARLRPPARPKPDPKAISASLEKAEARFNRGERTSDARKFA